MWRRSSNRNLEYNQSNMKTAKLATDARLIVATIMLAGTAGTMVAGTVKTDQGLAPKVIELPAPNNMTLTASVWLSKSAPHETGKSATAKKLTARVIELHAPNNPTTSVTIWTDK